MDITINNRLDKTFEILGLLCTNFQPEFLKKEQVLKSASEYGINGDELYKKFSGILGRYINAFKKESIQNEADAFFFEDDNFILILQTIFIRNQHWIGETDSMSDDEISLAIINAAIEDQEIDIPINLNKIIDLFHAEGLAPNICWKLMLLLQEPKKQITHLIEIINQNGHAYDKAIQTVCKPLKQLLDDFPNYNNKNTPSFKHDAAITPVLIYPVTDMLDFEGNTRYVGLFTKEFYRMMEKLKDSQNKLLPIMKAISDNSKFDILCSIKQSPKYNLELAELLGLTAATMSHHMSVLLTHGLVAVEKRDGRVYYSLRKEAIVDIINELQYAFIN